MHGSRLGWKLCGENNEAAKAVLLIEESAFGLSPEALGMRMGIEPSRARALSREANAWVIEPSGWAVSRAWMESRRKEMIQTVKAHHAATPLASGISKHNLKAQLMNAAPPIVFDAVLAGVPELATDGEIVRQKTHRVVLGNEEAAARQRVESAFQAAGLAVPAVAEVIKTAGLDVGRSQMLLRMLLKDRVLVRISEELIFHQSALAALKALLESKKGESFTVSVFKEWTGISRKFAVPLLEFLDREHVTVRTGDFRVVR